MLAGDAAFLPCGPLHRAVFTGGQLIPSEQRGREKERERDREREGGRKGFKVYRIENIPEGIAVTEG